MKSKDLSIGDIKVGDSAEFERTWTEADVQDFARLSGDENPMHTDEEYARTTKFGKRLVHGMLLGSLCSRLLGMYLPGKRCLYLRQSLSFKKPVFIGDTVKVRGTVRSKSEATGILDVSISMTKDSEEVVEGLATVQVLP